MWDIFSDCKIPQIKQLPTFKNRQMSIFADSLETVEEAKRRLAPIQENQAVDTLSQLFDLLKQEK